MELTAGRMKDMLEKMLKIRYFEEGINQVFQKGLMPGLAHLYIGEEAVAVGACASLRTDDYIVSTHRGHGHLIAKGGDLKRMMAEVMGKKDGYCKGKGGSMHICDLDLGILGAMGIVGAGVPIATGAALTAKVKGLDRVTVCFFGDGATNTGAFHEGVNMATAWGLPVVYICENNLYGISMKQQKAQNIKDIAVRAQAYGIPGAVVDGNDVLKVFRATSEAVERARRGDGPSLIECKTYRWGGHHIGDPGTSYRPKEEIEQWKNRCPIAAFSTRLIEEKVMTAAEVNTLKEQVAQQVQETIEFGENSTFPDEAEALEDVLGEDR